MTTVSPAATPRSSTVTSPATPADDHRARLGRAVRLHDEDEGPLLSLDDRGRWDDERVALREEREHDVHELARPERAILVLEPRLEEDGSRERVHGVVDEAEHAARRIGDAARAAGADVHRQGGAAVLPEQREVHDRHGEADEDRVDLVDRDERLSARLHEIPLLHEQAAGAAGDRRADGRELQVEPRGLDVRAVRRERGAVGLGGGLRLLVLLGGDVLLRDERLVALEVGLGVGELRLVAGEDPERLVEHRLIGARVDLEEELAGGARRRLP